MIKIVVTMVMVIWLLGFIGVMAIHTQLPATLGLALLRSALWPLALITGRWWPQGVQLPMD